MYVDTAWVCQASQGRTRCITIGERRRGPALAEELVADAVDGIGHVDPVVRIAVGRSFAIGNGGSKEDLIEDPDRIRDVVEVVRIGVTSCEFVQATNVFLTGVVDAWAVVTDIADEVPVIVLLSTVRF